MPTLEKTKLEQILWWSLRVYRRYWICYWGWYIARQHRTKVSTGAAYVVQNIFFPHSNIWTKTSSLWLSDRSIENREDPLFFFYRGALYSRSKGTNWKRSLSYSAPLVTSQKNSHRSVQLGSSDASFVSPVSADGTTINLRNSFPGRSAGTVSEWVVCVADDHRLLWGSFLVCGSHSLDGSCEIM